MRAWPSPCRVENIDTDQLIPARFMSAPRSRRLRAASCCTTCARAGRGACCRLPAERMHGGHDPRGGAQLRQRLLAGGGGLCAGGFRLSRGASRPASATSSPATRSTTAFCRHESTRTRPCGAGRATSGTGPVGHRRRPETTAAVSGGRRKVGFRARSQSGGTKLINGWDDIDLTRNHRPAHRRLRGARRTTRPGHGPQTRIETSRRTGSNGLRRASARGRYPNDSGGRQMKTRLLIGRPSPQAPRSSRGRAQGARRR